MLVTKHAAELCAHLVNDLFGELPARILASLFSKGRSSVSQLVHYTSLPPREVRHGLAVLVQQNLLFHQFGSPSPVPTYEANPAACYDLVRFGKVADMIGIEYGPGEQEIIQTLFQLGHARVSDLEQAFQVQDNSNHADGGSWAQRNGTNGHSNHLSPPSKHFATSQDLHTALARLVCAEILDQVGPKTFRDPEDVYREIEEEANRTKPGEKATKKKADTQRQIIANYSLAREESKKLKRQLDRTVPFSVKRRKLANGSRANEPLTQDHGKLIDPSLVLRVNFEKCLVDLRNQTLSRYAEDSLGETTAKVYSSVLRLLSEKVSRCRGDPRVDAESGGDADDDDDDDGGDPRNSAQQVSVSALQIFDALDPDLYLGSGIGKTSHDKINRRSAEKVRPVSRNVEYDSDESDEEDQGEEDSDVELEEAHGARPNGRGVNGSRGGGGGKVSFGDDAASDSDARFNQMRQHLLLLSESQQGFLRHSGTQGRGQFTVDFPFLMDNLRRAEVDAVIEQAYGRHGLRLTRILRQKGKLDEKVLPSVALMKKPDVQGKMLALQMAGFVDVQEVPRDNSRTANRTIFFWFFDEERVTKQLLDNVYKAMLRCLQTLDVQRHRERNILSFVERKDVRGKEEEVMTDEHYDKYRQFLDLQSKLLGHVMRLDDLISILKDY